jgi:hypothetical protein
MNRFHAAAFAVAFLVACSQDKQNVDTTTTQTPSQPTGSIVGVVTSLRTGAPLQGVTVSVPAPAGIISDTTDSNGAYALGGVPAGATYVVRFATTGYVPRFGYATIPNDAGDFPSDGIAQLDMAIAQSNATLSGHVYARDGAPAEGVVLTVDLRDQRFDLVATATTDAQGAYSLTGLPGAPEGLALEVVAQPWDANGDGLADYDAVPLQGTTYPAAASLLDFDLRVAAAELLLLTSNLESGLLPASASIQLTFNRALDAAFIDFTDVTLYDLTADPYGMVKVAVTVSLDITGKILTIVPAGGTALAAYHSYRLVVNAVATNGDTLVVSRSFTADVSTSLLDAVTGLVVSPTNADYNTASFTLSWKEVTNAFRYQVWVRDTNRNPDYLLVKTLGSSPAPSTPVTLPSTFDWYSDDLKLTPFAFGVAVDFAVVAVNAAGDAPSPTTATPVRRTDTVKPTVSQAVQSGWADNSGGSSPRTITLAVYFSEYMDPAFAPTIALPNVNMTYTFAWSGDHMGGTYSIIIPAGIDGRGSYSVSGAKDSSGNVMTSYTGTLTSTMQLITNGDFETGALDPAWTTSNSGTSTAPVATTAAAASGTYSAQVGNATTSTQNGYSRLYQNVTLPTGYSSIVASVRYRPYTTYAYSGWDYSACYIQNSTGTTLVTLFSTYQNSLSFSTATANITSYGGLTVRIMCQTYQVGSDITGMYLDNVSILATP